MSKGTFRSILSLIAFAAIMVLLLTRLDIFVTVVKHIFKVLTPFLVGFVLAYVLNIPYMFFMNKAFVFMDIEPKQIKNKADEFLVKLRKPLSLIITYSILFAVIVFLLSIIIPQITNSLQGVIDNFGVYYTSFQEWVFKVAARFGFEYEFMSDIFADINSFIAQYTGGSSSEAANIVDLNTIVQGLTNYLFPHIFDFTKNVYNVFYNFIISVIISIYYLANKETLMNQIKKITYSLVPQKFLGRVLRTVDICNNKVGKFLYGKLIDSTILGLLCFIVLQIFGIEYAVLLSVFVGVTNIIPFFGPIIGAIPGVILLVMINPIQALIFGIIIIVLQQIDGNFIGPKILGNQLGISGFWIMFSVLVGAGLFGFVGMLLGVPVFAVIYQICGEKVNNRLVKLGFATEANVRVDPLPRVAYEDGHIVADDEDDDEEWFVEDDEEN
ncbi:MAG: AI-2E family transporter [Acutalibacteraceae bacterium]|nr:AI-2E family transporter [Clostridia bacterium]MEE3449221.1 AI-2E family transporter [Acutalibacteraceae bacterium]